MSRSDVIPIDSRSHLEVADRKHRYAKNLRTYFKEYHRIKGLSEIVERSVPNTGNATPSRKWSRYEPFFDWLDVEEPLPNLTECPRTVLDEDKVEYLSTDAERVPYEITINAQSEAGDALWRMTQTGEPVNTGPKGWIFVLQSGRMYACEKRTNTFPRFHHSSFFAGAGVSAAGMLVCADGKLTKLFPHSGHYRPLDRHLYSLLATLREKGVDLAAVQVDVQRVMKLSRQQDKDGAKAKKTESAFYLDGETAFNFLKSKTGFQESGVLRQINKRRLEYVEGEQTPSVAVRARRAASNPPAYTPEGAGDISRGPALQHAMTIDTAGSLPALHKAGSGDSVSPSSHREHKLRLALGAAAPSNRSSLNRLSLNSTGASTVGSGSPFCSPVAEYQYPLRGSSSGGDLLAAVDATYAGSSSVFTGKGNSTKASPGSGSNNNSSYNLKDGLFCGSTSVDDDVLIGGGYDTGATTFDATFSGEFSRSGGRSSADARARVLSTLLYADTGKLAGPSLTTGAQGGSTGRSRGSAGTLPSSPPIPPNSRVSSSSANITSGNNNSVGGSGLLYVHTGIASTIPITKIPVAAPLKKVTSYTSISSSYGSTSYLQQQHQYYGSGGGSSRSRSASKTTDDLENDLRVLLGDSPVVHAPLDFNAYYSYGQEPSASSPTNGGSGAGSHNHSSSGPASTCNSRSRSRVSSFNPPYIPTSNATYANSNIAIAVSTAFAETPLGHKPSSGQNPRSGSAQSVFVGADTTGGSGVSGSGSRGQTPIMIAHSSPVDKVSPRASLIAHMSGTKVLSLSPSVALQDGAGTGQGHKAGRIEVFTPTTSHPAKEAAEDTAPAYRGLLTPTLDIAIPAKADSEADVDGAVAEGQRECPCPGSPVPSFASSLSSTDSLPNMMLDYMLSPGGTLLHCDGLYEEVDGDHYHDFIHGGDP